MIIIKELNFDSQYGQQPLDYAFELYLATKIPKILQEIYDLHGNVEVVPEQQQQQQQQMQMQNPYEPIQPPQMQQRPKIQKMPAIQPQEQPKRQSVFQQPRIPPADD